MSIYQTTLYCIATLDGKKIGQEIILILYHSEGNTDKYNCTNTSKLTYRKKKLLLIK